MEKTETFIAVVGGKGHISVIEDAETPADAERALRSLGRYADEESKVIRSKHGCVFFARSESEEDEIS